MMNLVEYDASRHIFNSKMFVEFWVAKREREWFSCIAMLSSRDVSLSTKMTESRIERCIIYIVGEKNCTVTETRTDLKRL